MKFRIVWIMIVCFILGAGAAGAELRTYQQVKAVVTKENGNVSQSGNKGDLFEYTYSVDIKKNTITRVKIQRLDKNTAQEDKTVYTITERRRLWGSEAGNGGNVFVAIQKDGNEILELGHRFAFTLRTSPFSQVITGVYKRVYDKDQDRKFRRHRPAFKK